MASNSLHMSGLISTSDIFPWFEITKFWTFWIVFNMLSMLGDGAPLYPKNNGHILSVFSDFKMSSLFAGINKET